jgi:hypothetical protein
VPVFPGFLAQTQEQGLRLHASDAAPAARRVVGEEFLRIIAQAHANQVAARLVRLHLHSFHFIGLESGGRIDGGGKAGTLASARGNPERHTVLNRFTDTGPDQHFRPHLGMHQDVDAPRSRGHGRLDRFISLSPPGIVDIQMARELSFIARSLTR